MAAPVIYWRGGEDSEYDGLGTLRAVDTTAGRFLTTGRCGLLVGSTGSNAGGANLAFWLITNKYSIAAGWWCFYMFASGTSGTASDLLRWTDATGVTRIRLRCTAVGGAGPSNGTYIVEKVTAAGVATQLGSSFSIPITSGGLGRLDVNIVYSAVGSVTIYGGGVSIYASGVVDTTTDANTTLNGHSLGHSGFGSFTTNIFTCWSGVIVADSDTRSFTLQTLAPVANGNTHNFDLGTPAAANVNEITLNDATFDGATAAGLIDQYTIPAIAAGSWAILDVAISSRCLRGAGGPQNAQGNVRVGGADFFTASQSPSAGAYANLQFDFAVDPNTGVGWTALPTNIGLKSIA